jgi:tryptophanyl-tRNA synthetase
VFSGVQPSGQPHLGNYLGAFRNYLAMQDGYEAIYCIVDYHALTSTHDGDRIRANAYEMALGLLALGLDPDRAILFRQSDRPEHAELSWLLSSVVPVSWVERTPSFKDKRRTQPDDVNHALLSYPVLQTADIAIYQARFVPVGTDQAAHLELAREIIRAWNARYGEYFVEPQAVFTDSPMIKGTDGVNKMSKSIGNTIDIFAPEAELRAQVMSMVTDTQRIKRTDPGRRRCATCASCTACSATTTRRSGTASGRRGRAASTPSACSPTASLRRSPRPVPGATRSPRGRGTWRRSCAPAPSVSRRSHARRCGSATSGWGSARSRSARTRAAGSAASRHQVVRGEVLVTTTLHGLGESCGDAVHQREPPEVAGSGIAGNDADVVHAAEQLSQLARRAPVEVRREDRRR